VNQINELGLTKFLCSSYQNIFNELNIPQADRTCKSYKYLFLCELCVLECVCVFMPHITQISVATSHPETFFGKF